MKRKIRSRRQRRIVGINFADPEDAGWGAPVAFRFVQSLLLLTGQTPSPGEPFLAEENRVRSADGLPWPGAAPLETLQGASHRVPVRGQSDNQLLTVVRDAGGMRGAGHEKPPCRQKQSSKHP